VLLRPSEGSLQDSQRIQLKAQTDIMYSFSSQSDFDGQIVKTVSTCVRGHLLYGIWWVVSSAMGPTFTCERVMRDHGGRAYLM
jgi:hypothetical protein